MNSFLDLLFKVKFLFKAFIFVKYIKQFKSIPTSIKVATNKNQPIINDYLSAFYLKGWDQFEVIETEEH